MSSVSHSNKAPNLRKGSQEPLIYSWLVRSVGGLAQGLQLAFEMEAVLWG